MPPPNAADETRTGNLYGTFAYGSVVLTGYLGYLAPQRFYGPEWLVLAVFGLGAVYLALGVLVGNYVDRCGPGGRAIYYSVQCALVTAIIFLSPSRGFMGIIVLPILSQAILDVATRYAVLIALYLFGINIVVWAIPYGWDGATRAVINYFAAFAFTIVFTIITKQAVGARQREGKLREEVEAANRLLRENASQAEDLATTRERNRVAREIHDGVGHYLTVVKTQLDAASALLPADPERAREAVTKAASLTSAALDDVRRSVGALRNEAARLPLPVAMQTLGQESGLPVTLRVEGSTRMLPPAVEHALFRAAQEGLTNIRKHAQATLAEMTLDLRTPGTVVFELTDNGRGRIENANAGFGLIGIRERIEVLGGRVEAGNRAKGGYGLRIEVPA